MRQAYVNDLLKEFTLLHQAFSVQGEPIPLDTIFFGGGTPTLLDLREWERIGEAIHRLFAVSPRAEWTVEANPGTVSLEQLQLLRQLGVNRLSFGAQTFNETLLQAIGRLHDVADIFSSVQMAMESGFERISLDLMFGLPDQTLQDTQEAIQAALATGVTHLSVYGLKVEPGTPFAKWEADGHLHLPDEDLQADMYDLVRDELQAKGFVQYEISNFAQPGQESIHNLTYWRNMPYFAAGAGAHGYVQQQRYENVHSLSEYSHLLTDGTRPVVEYHPVPLIEAMEDTMMLGLRLKEGVHFHRFEQLHGYALMDCFGETITDLLGKGLLLQEGERLIIPAHYYPVANEIFATFIHTANIPTIRRSGC